MRGDGPLERVEGGAERVLVIDDEPAILEALQDVLGAEGYEVEAASNGARALALLEHFRPDLILTDLMMPVMDGATLLRELRAAPRWAGIPVVVMSAGRLGGQDRALPFIGKPFELDALLALIRAQLSPEPAAAH